MKKVKPIRIGNIYGPSRGTGFAGNVWDKEGLSPTITTCGGGELQDADFLDCYNQTFSRGVSGTILVGINFRCMHYVIEIKDSPSD